MVAATVEVGEGDEVVGVAEAVGDSGQEPEFGVRRLDKTVGETVSEGVDDRCPVTFNSGGEIDELADP